MKSVPASVGRPVSLAHLQIEGSKMRKSKNSVFLSLFCSAHNIITKLSIVSSFYGCWACIAKYLFSRRQINPVNKYGIPNLKPNEVWVSSIPLNLKVYVAGQTY